MSVNLSLLFLVPMTWVKDETRKATYVSNKLDPTESFLRMNDFPEEPMWTLFHKGESMDFDDKPAIWKVEFGG